MAQLAARRVAKKAAAPAEPESAMPAKAPASAHVRDQAHIARRRQEDAHD
jgi:hypothetical protein